MFLQIARGFKHENTVLSCSFEAVRIVSFCLSQQVFNAAPICIETWSLRKEQALVKEWAQKWHGIYLISGTWYLKFEFELYYFKASGLGLWLLSWSGRELWWMWWVDLARELVESFGPHICKGLVLSPQNRTGCLKKAWFHAACSWLTTTGL